MENTLPFILFALILGLSGSFATPTLRNRNSTPWRFPYDSQKVRGVNLGGWLVLEPWLVPGVFGNLDTRVIDEWTLGLYVDRNAATGILENHWATWVSEDDFIQMAAAGLNHVRIPIGYWAFDVAPGEPYHQGQLRYLYRAIGWAKTHGLKVWIDLHGAPGSQNGLPESGQKKPYPEWQLPINIARTSAIVKTLVLEFSQPQYADVVTAVAPLNEPAGAKYPEILNATRQFYYNSYGGIRNPDGMPAGQGPLVEVISDAFMNLSYWQGFVPYHQFEGVVMDVHPYQVFGTADLTRTLDQQVKVACARGVDMLAYASNNTWVVAGEWSSALTDCAGSTFLNSRATGSIYDGTFPNVTMIGSCQGKSGNLNNFSPEYKASMRKYWEAQTAAFEKVGGWIYWTWKADNADDWSYQAGLAGGWIPRDPTDRIYPNICG